MTYETYVLVLCLIVYLLLSVTAIAVVCALTKMSLRLILHGAEDKDIIKEYTKACKKGHKKTGKVCETLFTVFLCIIFVGIFAFSLCVNLRENVYFDKIPTVKVVQSDSMSEKYMHNNYLKENNLNDQFDMFDIILVYKAPAEEELKLYDIVVFEMEKDDEVVSVIHRIVGIEEPNEKHPNERLFKTQGDAAAWPDSAKVKYSQIKAIYRGERVPFVGSFIMFMQSPAGWMCMILMLVATIATPIIDKKLEKERRKRLGLILQEQRGQANQHPSIYYFPVYYNPALGIPFTDVVFSQQAHQRVESAKKGERR